MRFGRAGFSVVVCVLSRLLSWLLGWKPELSESRALAHQVTVNMSGSKSDPLSDSAPIAWKPRLIAIGLLILSITALISLISYLGKTGSKVDNTKAAVSRPQVSDAEIISASGTVLVRKLGRIEWQEVKEGARLEPGDLVQTDNSGDATIEYSNGSRISIPAKTIFTVQTAGSSKMEISALPLEFESEAGALSPGSETVGAALHEASADLRPSIELQRIIPFGRSLELIGKVEAGSRLTVNGETVDVTGDGSFKHFTNPFPASAGEVRLIMKVADLSGRTRILTATYDFSSRARGR